MWVQQVWLHDFRCYRETHVEFAEGLTVVSGSTGSGKTSLLEAIAYVATLSSFRGAPTDAMVRLGAERGVSRAQVFTDGREVLLEAEIVPAGRNRLLVNKQPLRRQRDLREVLRVSVFSPDDLVLVKGGPSERRGYLDDLLVALHPRNEAVVGDVERILRQRNALLKQTGGRLTDEIGFTLDVWDQKLATAGTALGRTRVEALETLRPWLDRAYADIAGSGGSGQDGTCVESTYQSAWHETEGGLEEALVRGRVDDVRRGLTLTGPHRDDVTLLISGRPSRTHASQGEQRTLALALRLAAHRLVAETIGSAPVLLLDDVFSELDPQRSAALLHNLPPGQTIVATASPVPSGAVVDRQIAIATGAIGAIGGSSW